jgi:hypothetical protein
VVVRPTTGVGSGFGVAIKKVRYRKSKVTDGLVQQRIASFVQTYPNLGVGILAQTNQGGYRKRKLAETQTDH